MPHWLSTGSNPLEQQQARRGLLVLESIAKPFSADHLLMAELSSDQCWVLKELCEYELKWAVMGSVCVCVCVWGGGGGACGCACVCVCVSDPSQLFVLQCQHTCTLSEEFHLYCWKWMSGREVSLSTPTKWERKRLNQCFSKWFFN